MITIRKKEIFLLDDTEVSLTHIQGALFEINVYVEGSFERKRETENKIQKTRSLLRVFKDIQKRPINLQCVAYEGDGFRKYRENIFRRLGFKEQGERYQYIKMKCPDPKKNFLSKNIEEWGYKWSSQEECFLSRGDKIFLYEEEEEQEFYLFVKKKEEWIELRVDPLNWERQLVFVFLDI
ncbi:hypothetical protein V6O07_00410 [Arthrospira platensis SPKY2]